MNKYLFHIIFLIKSSILFSQSSDSLAIPSLFLKKLEQNISRNDTQTSEKFAEPELKNKWARVNVTLDGEKLRYKVSSSETYSLESGWFVLLIIMKGRILFSKVLNENGKMAFYTDTFSIKNLAGGIIKVVLYKKGGHKIAEMQVCYEPNSS